MRWVIYILFAAMLSVSSAYADEGASVYAPAQRPFEVAVSAEGAVLFDVEKGSSYVDSWQHRSEAALRYRFPGTTISLAVTQPFYNTFIENGFNGRGDFTLGDTELEYLDSDLGIIKSLGLDFSAGFRVAIPASLITDDKRDSGFLTYFMPSLTVQRLWGRFSLTGSAASQLFLYTKDTQNVWGYKDGESKEKVLFGTKPNNLFRQYLSLTAGYAFNDRLAINTKAEFQGDVTKDPGRGRGFSDMMPRLMVVPSVSVAITRHLTLESGVAFGGIASVDGSPYLISPMSIKDAWTPYKLLGLGYNTSGFSGLSYRF